MATFISLPTDLSILTGLKDRTLETKEFSKMTDEELLQELKRLPEFESLVMPNAWYAKFKLPEKKCRDMKEYIKDSPWKNKHSHWYVGKVETIEAQPGGNRPILPAPEVPVITVVGSSYSDSDNPINLAEYGIKDQTVVSDQQETQQSSSDSKEASATKPLRL